MITRDDTIFALSSNYGSSAVAIIRISGKNIQSIVDHKIIKKIPKHQNIILMDVMDCKTVLDTCLVSFFKAPHSFTGEDVMEINTHGGTYIVDRLLTILNGLPGFSPAMPGEFIYRAFNNGKMTLTEVEHTLDIIQAETEFEYSIAFNNECVQFFDDIHQKIFSMVANVEAFIDFADDNEGVDIDNIAIQDIIDILKQEINRARYVQKGRSGLRVVLTGEVNVGKSSILNMLMCENVAITSDIPGTTRDVVKDYIIIDGIKVMMMDTAGIRATSDSNEKIGIDLAHEAVKNADVVLRVFDASNPPVSICKDDLYKSENDIIVFNKIDIAPCPMHLINDGHAIGVSAINGTGRDAILEIISKKIQECKNIIKNSALRSPRYLLLAENLLSKLHILNDSMHVQSIDIVAHLLRECLVITAQLTQKTYCNESVLGEVFSKFCIGK